MDFPILMLALSSVRRRLLRSVLLALVAAVGIAAVVSTVAIIQGASHRFHEDLSKVGLDVVNVQPPLSMANILAGPPAVSPEAIAALRPLLGKKATAMARVALRPARVAAGEEGVTTQCLATDAEGVSMRGLPLLAGRLFLREEAEAGELVCVLDEALVRRVFTGPRPGSTEPMDPAAAVGREVRVRVGERELGLTVLGVLKDPYLLRDQLEDFDSIAMARHSFARILEFKNLYMPIALLGPDPEIGVVMLRAPGADKAPSLVNAAEKVLKAAGCGELRVWSQGEWVSSALDTTDSFMLLGNLVWMVLLAIASIMILTISLLAVRERYREVAIRRTEGARRRDVVRQFALESLTISMAGGVAGSIMGVGFARFISTAPLGGNGEPLIFWTPYFTLGTFLLAGCLAAAVGIVATVLPARAVAALDPVQVLKRG